MLLNKTFPSFLPILWIIQKRVIFLFNIEMINVSWRCGINFLSHLKPLTLTTARGTDFSRSLNRGKAYLKRNSRFSAKRLLINSKKHTLLSKQTFQCYFKNRNRQYLTTLIFVRVYSSLFNFSGQ